MHVTWGNKKKPTKKTPKPQIIKPTLGRVIKEEFRSSVKQGLRKNFGFVGDLVANRMDRKEKVIFDKNAGNPEAIKPLKSKSLHAAIKEHSGKVGAELKDINSNASKGYRNLIKNITKTQDRVVGSLTKMEDALDWHMAGHKNKPQQAQPTQPPPLPEQKKKRIKDKMEIPDFTWLKNLPWGLLGKTAAMGGVIGGGVGYLANSLNPREQKIQDEMLRREKAGEPDPKFKSMFRSWDSIKQRIIDEWNGTYTPEKGDDEPSSKTKSKKTRGPVPTEDAIYALEDYYIKKLDFKFDREIKFTADKISFKNKKARETSSAGSALSVQGGTAQQRYQDNVEKYGKEKADILRDMENRPTSVGGLLSRLSPSNWFGGADQKEKNLSSPGHGDHDHGHDHGDQSVPKADKSKTGDYKEGTERLSHASGNMNGLDPKLLSVMKAASKDLPEGYHAEIISAVDARTTGTTNHPGRIASDIKIYDNEGRLVPHDRGGPGMKYYEQFHQSMVERGKVMTPGETYIWGGTWISRAAGNGDPMHMQRKDPSVPGSSQSSGAYNDDKGAKGHPFEPYLMNDKERAEYKQKVREKALSEGSGGDKERIIYVSPEKKLDPEAQKIKDALTPKDKPSAIPSDADMKKADDKWFKGNSDSKPQSFLDQSILDKIDKRIESEGGPQRGLLPQSEWNKMNDDEKFRWQITREMTTWPEYQPGQPWDAGKWKTMHQSPNVEDRSQNAFNPQTGEYNLGPEQSKEDFMKSFDNVTETHKAAFSWPRSPLAEALGHDLFKRTKPSIDTNEVGKMDIPELSDPKLPEGAKEFKPDPALPSYMQKEEYKDTWSEREIRGGNWLPDKPFYDEKPFPKSGPTDFSLPPAAADLTPPRIQPVINQPETTTGFRKYEGNGRYGTKERATTNVDDDREVGRRSFSEYTNNSYDEAG